MLSNSWRSRGWPGLRQSDVSTVKPSGRQSSEGGGGVPMAGVLGGGGGVAKKLLRDDVVLMVGLAGAEGWCSVRSTVRPSGGGVRAHRRCGGRRSGARKRNWMG
jgi:hypothetical protein